MHARDAPQVLAINRDSRPGVAPLEAAELSRLMALPHEHRVATHGSGVAGYLLAFQRGTPYEGEEFLAFRQSFSGPYLYVDPVAVAPALRATGVGRRLYAAIQSVAALQGTGVLCCEVNLTPPNPGSQAFHRRLGFSPVATLTTRDGRDVELLAKSLPG